MSFPSVWAPIAKEVQLVTAGQRTLMRRDQRGWWHPDADLQAGADYTFLVDGEGPFPDPRSQWQPNGVSQPSRVYEQQRYQWQDLHWRAPALKDGLIYELHIGTFSPQGTYQGALAKLDYLVNLGVTHVELMPVAEYSGKWGWGYDGVQLFAPHHAYGEPDELKAFVDACHGKGLAVLLDVVYNHLGPAGNYLHSFGPYFTHRYNTPWGDAVNFDDQYSDEVRRFFIDNALMWLRDYHFDGLRLDAVHAIFDQSAVPFLKQLRMEVDRLQERTEREYVLIAESDLNDPKVVVDYEHGGFGLDCQWSDDFHHAIHALLTDEQSGYYADFGRISHLAKALQNGFVYDGEYSAHRKRHHGAKSTLLSGEQLLGYCQTHDQVGNRATGERLGHLLQPGQIKIAAALVLMSPFVPMLFQGEEWATSSPFLYFTDHEDPELARAVSEGRRSEFADFGWNPEDIPDPQDEQTFLRSQLNWQEMEKGVHADILGWYRELIGFRKKHPQLAAGSFKNVIVQYDEAAKWLILKRGYFALVCNFASHAQDIILAEFDFREIHLSSETGVQYDNTSLHLPPFSVALLS